MSERTSLCDDARFADWVEAAPDNNAREWSNEEARMSKNLYVGGMTERDRRSVHGEARRGIRSARRFWKAIPVECRELVANEAGLPLTAIPEDLRND